MHTVQKVSIFVDTTNFGLTLFSICNFMKSVAESTESAPDSNCGWIALSPCRIRRSSKRFVKDDNLSFFALKIIKRKGGI